VPRRNDRGVFINCPFDPAYRQMFDAIVFAVLACRFVPRSALEIVDGGKPRIRIISELIAACHLSVHDVSRVEPNENGLPRFNMPLELGLWLGAEQFGNAIQKRKKCLILEFDPYRYQQFISDIGGQDIKAHQGEPRLVIRHVRDFLLAAVPDNQGLLPGGADIFRRFGDFQAALPELCAEARVGIDELTFTDHARMARRCWHGFLLGSGNLARSGRSGKGGWGMLSCLAMGMAADYIWDADDAVGVG